MQATDHLLLLWLGPVFAFFMAFAGLMGSYFAELPPSCAPRARACFNVDAASPPSRRCCWARCPPPSASAPSIAACGGVFVIAAAVVLLLPAGKTAAAEEPVAAH